MLNFARKQLREAGSMAPRATGKGSCLAFYIRTICQDALKREGQQAQGNRI